MQRARSKGLHKDLGRSSSESGSDSLREQPSAQQISAPAGAEAPFLRAKTEQSEHSSASDQHSKLSQDVATAVKQVGMPK